MTDPLRTFFYPRGVAILGASSNSIKLSHGVLRNLVTHGFRAPVYPVNPRLKELDGVQCYPTLDDIPVEVDVVDFVVPPEVTERTLCDCKRLGLERIWLQPGSESEAALNYCSKNNLKVVHDTCVMLN